MRTYFSRFLLLVLMLWSVSLSALAVDSLRVIRAGWFDSPYFQIDADGNRSGHSYEYQLKVGAIAGWTFEYVEGSWTELFEKLKHGEIDLLSGVTPTPERAEHMLFSQHEMTCEDFALMVRKDCKTIRIGDYQSLNGATIGLQKGVVQNRMFRDWVQSHGVKCNILEFYADAQTMRDYLREGKIDGIVSPPDVGREQFLPVFHISSSNMHFALSKARPELKNELDVAMDQIRTTNPGYLYELYEKYHSNSLLSHYLPEHECQWLRQHQKIRVGFRDNYLPFCKYNAETGMLEGMLQDFSNLAIGAFENADFEIEAIPYPTINEAIAAVQRGEVDAAFPYGEALSDAELEHLVLSDPLYTSIEMAVIREVDQYRPDMKLRAAINSRNPNYLSLLRRRNPHWQIVDYPNTIECLKGIARGEADLLLLSSYRLGVLSQYVHESRLRAVPTGMAISYGFAARAGDTEVYNILNRLTDMMDDNAVRSSLVNHSDVSVQTTVLEFIEQHMLPFFAIFFTFTAIILYLLYRSIKDRRRTFNAYRSLASMNSQQEAHIREIQVLNNDLEERQAQLEEITAEQESQIEEIQTLNRKLTENRVALENSREAAEAANQAKTSFLFNMSHDIRTPMNAIIGFTDLLTKHQDEPVKRADYLDKIRKSSGVLLSIINNVLEMARIEKGTILVEETAESVMQFNDMLFTIFRDMMQQKGLTFTRSVNVQHRRVMCDITKLREIFYNILSNAYKYTEPGGTIDMSLEELPCQREGYVLFRTTISDTGMGMSEEFLPHIFEEFSRERNTTDNKIEGTGLGMPIVKRLVELMQGTVEVKSQKGKGTTFIVDLPLKIAECNEEQEVSTTTADPAQFKGKRILLAEDNDLNAEIAMEILVELGFVVDRAVDGMRCVEKLQQSPAGYYDIILMDIQMPCMNGYEATRAIRALADRTKARIPIFAMTANAFEEDKREAARAGMNGHLAKPVDVSELIKTLASSLSQTAQKQGLQGIQEKQEVQGKQGIQGKQEIQGTLQSDDENLL